MTSLATNTVSTTPITSTSGSLTMTTTTTAASPLSTALNLFSVKDESKNVSFSNLFKYYQQPFSIYNFAFK